MYRARADNVQGRYVYSGGKRLVCIGNAAVSPGDLIWTDGRCVYGHHSTCGGSAVITAAMEPEKNPGIPVLLGQQYLYTYKEGLEQVETVWWPGYRLIWNNGQEIYAWKYRYDVDSYTIAANKKNGVLYEVKGFRSLKDLQGAGKKHYVAGIYADGELLHSIDCSDHVWSDESISEGLYSTIPADPTSARDIPSKTCGAICDWAFIEDESHWAVMIVTGCTQGRLKGTCMAASLHYYTPEGETLLSSTSGTIIDGVRKTYYDGGFGGIRFPCQDGFFFTVNPIPDVAWAIKMPGIFWVTLYNSAGEIIYEDYFVAGMYFTICQLGGNEYLLGVADRDVFIGNMTTTVGWNPSYEDPDYVDSGLYLIKERRLEPLMVGYSKGFCRNQRFAIYNRIDKWSENIKEL